METREVRDKTQTKAEYISSKIFNADRTDIFQDAAKRYCDLKKSIIIDSIVHSKSNLDYYDKFMERVKDEKYFDLKHITELGLPFDILIFLSKKGIGKSYYMIKQCNEIVDAGHDVAIMRVIEEDVKMGLSRQLIDYDANFTIDSKGFLYHKTQTEPDPKNPNKEVPRKCGVAFALTTCLKLKGGGFPRTKLMVFDEASDKRKGVTTKHYEDFIISVANSIEREKNVESTQMPWIVYGNTDFDSSHPLFEAFQIDPDEHLVYVNRQPQGANRPCRILYINSRGLYKSGASNSVFIGSIGNVQRAMSAFVNEASNLSSKVISLDLTFLADPVLCVIFRKEKEHYYVKVAEYTNNTPYGEEWCYFISGGPFNPYYCYGYDCYTDDPTISSVYSYLDVDLKDKEDLSDIWLEVKEILGTNKCFFVGWDLTEILSAEIKRYVKEDNSI